MSAAPHQYFSTTTIFLAMKNSIIFISTLSLVAMMLGSCGSVSACDEPPTTGRNEPD
jgi:hypothetical protein